MSVVEYQQKLSYLTIEIMVARGREKKKTFFSEM
jgi:hypothetical protein